MIVNLILNELEMLNRILNIDLKFRNEIEVGVIDLRVKLIFEVMDV